MLEHAFPLRTFQQTGAAKTAKGSLSVSHAQLVDIQDLAKWDDSLLPKISTFSGAYPSIFGGLELRNLVAELLGVDAASVIITNGVDDAIPCVYEAILQRGDTLSLLDPTYDPLVKIAQQFGANIKPYNSIEKLGCNRCFYRKMELFYLSPPQSWHRLPCQV